MDINALLSPDDSTSSSASPAEQAERPPSLQQQSPQRASRVARPAPGGGKRSGSGLSQEIRRSPDIPIASPTSNTVSSHGTPANPRQTAFSNAQAAVLAAPNFRPLPPTSTPLHDSTGHATQQAHYQYAQQRPIVAHRPSSTPQMETLADLASMQQRQQTTRTYSANNVRGDSDRQQQTLHSPLSHVAPPLARTVSRQSLADITMAEAPAQTPPPRDFTSNALSDVEAKEVMELLNYLAENSYAYAQHVQLINLLHKGFISHVYPPAGEGEPSPPGDPYSYALLTELRQARDAMYTRFAVGETIWLDWLSDEILLARSSEERVNVTELFNKATTDEPASVKIWNAYVDWLHINYAECHDLEGADTRNWTADDKEVCKELFTRAIIVDVLEQAVQATQWRIDESHVIWNRYIEMVKEEFPQQPSDADIQRLHSIFVQRLKTPHLNHEETMQLYWPIISKFEGDNWENAIAGINNACEPAKIHANIRSEHEFKLRRAQDSGDETSTYHELEKYIKSEKFHHKKKGPFDYELRFALYERTVLMFPTVTEWWLDFIDFAVTSDPSGSRPLLPLIERATRHCPWSGDLWARRILRADVERQSRQDIESIKHRATNAGLIDVGGMEELVKMLQQWCSFLRRYAFHPSAGEDEIDEAEVGITMALEDVQQAGTKIYGADFPGDDLFRLEKIQIKFYSEARRFEEARGIYRQLVPRLAKRLDFWAQYYNWELWLWGYDRVMEQRRVETDENGPDTATAVVREALSQRDIDWPEKVLEMYLAHFQQHESGARLQQALADAREYSTRLAARRAKEAEESAAAAARQQEEHVAAAQASKSDEAPTGEKRKREDEHMTNGDSHKKAKTDEPANEPTEASASASARIKRDREHNTITVKNLSQDVDESAIKKLFRDCGDILSINFLKDKDGASSTATVEFGATEDVTTAMTRNGKEVDGREIHIQRGTQSTIYVTNYPAEYDEDRIRDLFKSYGDIVSIRLPSLKYNSRRRFAYVQFLTAEMARTAESAMDGKSLGGPYTLVAKISNPDAKKDRTGAQVEGREIIVKNLDREAPETEVKDFFSPFGEVVKLNLLRQKNGTPTGIAFIAYSSADEAKAAVDSANNKPFRDRILTVALTESKGRADPLQRAHKEDINIKAATASASPEPTARRGSDVSMASAPTIETNGTAHARKIAIFNIPDTVNDARIRTAMEKYGQLVKIQLRRDREGAIVEFTDAKAAFNVRQGVDVSSLGSNASAGDVGVLLSKKKVAKAPKLTNETASTTSSASALAFIPPAASRSGGTRGARRGGLGFKRGGNGSGARTASAAPEAPSNTQGGAAKKSNSDFRSMLEASKKDTSNESAAKAKE